jgi:hypothetical protein
MINRITGRQGRMRTRMESGRRVQEEQQYALDENKCFDSYCTWGSYKIVPAIWAGFLASGLSGL